MLPRNSGKILGSVERWLVPAGQYLHNVDRDIKTWHYYGSVLQAAGGSSLEFGYTRLSWCLQLKSMMGK